MATKLLLIDDDPAVLQMLSAKLARHYQLISTRDPRAVLDLARAEKPDVIVCDIDMPGMSGGEVAAALNADPVTAFIPVIYLTALVSPEEAQELKGQLGGRPGVSKRARLRELVSRIEAAAASSHVPG